ncbi:Breast cancer type 2 susceptibility protein-like [Armadillidium vulgare]|nr:Breast cancer type 2 susceptibility protein-like [Armadillidium vulgare]
MRKRDEDDLYKFYQNNKVRSFSNCNTNWIEVIKEKWLSNDNENEENTEIGDCSFGALKMSILEGDKSIYVKKNTTKEIALSLGIEQDQSSVSRLSSILTPVTSKFHNTSVLKTSPEVIAKNASCGKNQSVLGKLSKSCSSPELATELTKDSLSSEMSENHRPSTQGFNIVGMRALQEICKESLTGLATPEAAKYSHEKNSKNDNSLPITSTPLSHFKSISKKTIYNRSKFESGLYFKPLHSPIHSSENGRFNQRLRFESQENLSVSGIDENFSNVLEFSKSSQGKKTETSHEHKFSRLSLKKKKKFVYPSIEEEVNEELALKSEILSKSTDNLNAVGFKSASILKESIVEDCSRINVKNPIPKAEMFEEFDVQEKSCIFGSELCKSVVQSESIVCGKKTTCMDEIKCDNLKDKINDLDMLEIKICSSSDRGDEKYLKIKNKENMDTLETENIKSMKAKHSVQSDLSVSSVSGLRYGKTGAFSFPGFQSAAGKKVNVNSDALLKAKALLNDEQNYETEPLGKNDDLLCNSYITGEDEIKDAIQINTNSPVETLAKHVNKENQTLSEFSFPMFQSASGSKINISSEALKKTKVIMDEACDDELELNQQGKKSNFTGGKYKETYESSQPSTSQVRNVLTSPCSTLIEEKTGLSTPNFPGFQSAAGKKINVNMKALQKAKFILDELENNKDETEARKNDKKTIQIKSSSSLKTLTNHVNMENRSSSEFSVPRFQSASGSKIKVSSEALERAKVIMDEAELNRQGEKICNFTNGKNEHTYEKSRPSTSQVERVLTSPLTLIEERTGLSTPNFVGFQSAAGKKINVSVKALQKAKSILDELENNKKETKAPEFEMAILSEASASDTSIINEELNFMEAVKLRKFNNNNNNNNGFMKAVFPGLYSASGKKINVSSEALEKAKAILDDEADELNNDNKAERKEKVFSPLKFQTANNKNVIISPSSLLKVKSMFDNCHTESNGDKHEYEAVSPVLGSQKFRKNSQKRSLQEDDFASLQKTVKMLKRDFEENDEKDEDDMLNVHENMEINEATRAFLLDSSWDETYSVQVEREELVRRKLELIERKMKDGIKCENNEGGSLFRFKISHKENRVQLIFTLEEVVRQIRFRYDIEVLEGKRSVLRKIYEQDDTPRKTMILCVFDILKNEQNPNSKTTENESSDSYTLTLTDGWYIIESQIDSAMISLITKKKIKIGMKLLIHGAELIASPSPCHPLQMAKDGVTLKIHTNMCRLSAWHSKLGLFKKVGVPSSTVLSAILDDGGIVGSLTGILCRRYPVAFLEKRDNRTTFVNERVYEARKRTSEIEQESLMEKLYDQVEKELEKDERTKWNNSISLNNRSVESLADGEEICGLIEQTYDASVIQGLSEEQIQLAKNCREEVIIKQRQKINKEVKLRAKKLQEIYRAVPVLKLGVRDKNGKEAVITVWRPHEEILSLQEGKTFSFHYLSSSATRFNVKHLSWTKQSFIKNSEASLSPFKSSQYVISEYSNITSSYLDEVPFHEIDVVGVVVKVLDVKDEAQNVYLTDVDHNFIVLRFSPSIIDFQYQDAIQKGRIICAVNCNWRNQYFNGFYVLNVTPFTHISSAIQKHNDSVMKLVNKMKDPSFVSDAERKLDDLCLNNCNQEYCSDLPSVDGTGCSLNTPKLKSSLYSLSVLSRPFRTPIRHQKNNS